MEQNKWSQSFMVQNACLRISILIRIWLMDWRTAVTLIPSQFLVDCEIKSMFHKEINEISLNDL